MKDRLFVSPSRLACLGVVLSSLLLASCSKLGDFPTKDTESLVTKNMGSQCKLVSVLEHKPLAPVNDLQRVAVRYEADCLPEGGQQARRIRYVMTFDQRESWFGKEWVKFDNAIESDPLPAAGAASTLTQTAIATAATEWSEAPECNAALKRVATEVVPCIAQVDPELAGQLRDWVESAKIGYRLYGNVTQREAALLQLDQDCLYQWNARNKMIGEEPKLKQCALR